LNPPRKQRTREHVLADFSANHVEKVALQCGYAVERLTKDHGMDLAIFTLDEKGYRENGVIWVQLKASDHVKTTSNGKAVVVRLDRRDVVAWIGEIIPVILVLHDGSHDRAWWLSIQSHFAKEQVFAALKGKTVAVSIPIENRLTASAMRDIACEKAAVLAPQGAAE
jgi:hypothetical protein